MTVGKVTLTFVCNWLPSQRLTCVNKGKVRPILMVCFMSFAGYVVCSTCYLVRFRIQILCVNVCSQLLDLGCLATHLLIFVSVSLFVP
jgi:hypothetical protein